jgi:hypothetical protein
VKRRLWNVLAAASLVLFVANLALWMRSLRHSEIVVLITHEGTHHYAFEWDNGRFDFEIGWSNLFNWVPPPSYHGWHLSEIGRDSTAPYWNSYWSSFNVGYGDRWQTSFGVRAGLRFWEISLILSALPCLWWIAKARERRIRRRGLCPVCGYDLRATPDRCPECGTVQKKPT